LRGIWSLDPSFKQRKACIVTTTDVEEQLLHLAGEQKARVRKALAPHKAQEQLNRWMNDKTELGMIYARPKHQANVWARVTINSQYSSRLVCENEHMNFMLVIVDATFSIESLQSWNSSMPPAERSVVEGLQIWCADGDWLFLTEQIAQSRALSLKQSNL
jgi:hypothetical protein